jgi:hypothetical protein
MAVAPSRTCPQADKAKVFGEIGVQRAGRSRVGGVAGSTNAMWTRVEHEGRLALLSASVKYFSLQSKSDPSCTIARLLEVGIPTLPRRVRAKVGHPEPCEG